VREEKKQEILQRLKQHYKVADDYGYDTVGIFLQGSQNYGLDTENSDIDSKVIVVPKLDDFVFNKLPVSFTHIMENEEHVDFKDIRLMLTCFKKQNINFVEILFTDYFILNPDYEKIWNKLRKEAEAVARYNEVSAVNCMAGMAYQKQKALTHPYPSLVDKIEKYGYDAKQLHHILRLREFIERYIAGVPYKECLHSEKRDELVKVKNFCYGAQDAIDLADKTVKEIADIKQAFISSLPEQRVVDAKVDFLLEDVASEIIKAGIIKELSI